VFEPSLRAKRPRPPKLEERRRKQSRGHKERLDCFVASLLAMTDELLPCPTKFSFTCREPVAVARAEAGLEAQGRGDPHGFGGGRRLAGGRSRLCQGGRDAREDRRKLHRARQAKRLQDKRLQTSVFKPGAFTRSPKSHFTCHAWTLLRVCGVTTGHHFLARRRLIAIDSPVPFWRSSCIRIQIAMPHIQHGNSP
jgi:hypothetical protein